jgi:hypothetical protein
MTAKISQSAWCLRQSVHNPAHYGRPGDLTQIPTLNDTLVFSARVGTEERGYDLRVSLDFEDIQKFYRQRCVLDDVRLAEEIAYLSARLAKNIAIRATADRVQDEREKRAKEKETAA